jgi:hypothetical protein
MRVKRNWFGDETKLTFGTEFQFRKKINIEYKLHFWIEWIDIEMELTPMLQAAILVVRCSSLVEHGACDARVVCLIPVGDQYDNVFTHYFEVALDKRVCYMTQMDI